ncbi:dCTP deaminase [Vibrio cholerae]|uniref:dCTP deaminase n=1 Tax=Vibrio cholerae TaxID=666 RepID=UPI001A2A4323|nr:hypothetical protein [Vibrio cholerae]EGR4455606.1 hypothetical protein [Vibrio cholerae]ELL7182942.1 hypothetical protein [Vibrio cholerae]MDV2348095.1 hypothetical protein [Vibrio cholerae]GIA25861.1 dCTP deaminase [Vibrio cholerae]HAS3627265.1 hypothetical protein [Vibrio cholerae]
MYLSNNELLKILPEMEIECEDDDYEFDPSKQVKVCSIDIRMDKVFWLQEKSGSPINLRPSTLMKTSPFRFWRRIEIGLDEEITLKPGHFILGRTYEKFTIPKGYAGKIITRSSYTRLGIETSCTNDFINPGCRARIPLELINNSINTYKLPPLLPICQIMLIPLSSVPSEDYSTKRFRSKYIDDDASPSLWWKDDLIERLDKFNIGSNRIEEIISMFSNLLKCNDQSVLFRFESYLSNMKVRKLSNRHELLEGFIFKEKRRAMLYKILRGSGLSLFPILIATSIGISLDQPYRSGHHAIWLSTLFSIAPFLYYWLGQPKRFLTVDLKDYNNDK